MKIFLVVILLSLLALVAHAAGAPPDPGADPAGFAGWLYQAFTAKDWPIFFAGLILGGVALFRYAAAKLQWAFFTGKAAGWLLAFLPAAALAFISAVITGKPVVYALAGAVMSSALAAIGWELGKDVKEAALK